MYRLGCLWMDVDVHPVAWMNVNTCSCLGMDMHKYAVDCMCVGVCGQVWMCVHVCISVHLQSWTQDRYVLSPLSHQRQVCAPYTFFTATASKGCMNPQIAPSFSLTFQCLDLFVLESKLEHTLSCSFYTMGVLKSLLHFNNLDVHSFQVVSKLLWSSFILNSFCVSSCQIACFDLLNSFFCSTYSAVDVFHHILGFAQCTFQLKFCLIFNYAPSPKHSLYQNIKNHLPCCFEAQWVSLKQLCWHLHPRIWKFLFLLGCFLVPYTAPQLSHGSLKFFTPVVWCRLSTKILILAYQLRVWLSWKFSTAVFLFFWT